MDDRMEVEDVEEEEEEMVRGNRGEGGIQIAGLAADLPPQRAPKQETVAASSSSAPAPGNPSRWPVIYTVYINSQRTLKQGRRLPKGKGVDNPTVQEMMDSCAHLKIPVLPEDKAYPRDFIWGLDRGRIRVQLKDSSGNPINPDIPNKMALMLKLAALIPKHHGRTRKDAGPAKKETGEKEKGKAPLEEKKKGKGKKKK